MSGNSSSLPPSSFFSTSMSFLVSCFRSTVGTFNITAFTIASVLLLLPLYVYVLYLGLQRCRKQRSNTRTSHSDVFTYHMVVVELISVLGSTITCCGVHTDLPQMIMVGIGFFNINISGQMSFHVLTCVERYLAIVHPITYLSLRKEKGIRIRNITTCCVWLLCIAGTGVLYVEDKIFIIILSLFTTIFILAVVSFLSLSVLCVLIRPGPGEGGGGRQWVDQSKLRAFYTIMAILGVLLFRLGGYLLFIVGVVLNQLRYAGKCAAHASIIWFCVPSSLVLPLLFLHRAGKLVFVRTTMNNDEDHIRLAKI